MYFHKATSTYSLRSKGVSYSRTREIVLQALVELGYPKNLFGLHSLRAGALAIGLHNDYKKQICFKSSATCDHVVPLPFVLG